MSEAKVDYSRVARMSAGKALVRRTLLLPWVNRAAVAVLGGLPDSAWRSRIPVARSATLQLDGAETLVLLRADRCQVAKEVFWGAGRLRGAADRLALDAVLRLCGGADLFLDIGAYTGLFALSVARRVPGAVVHAYEIVPENFMLLWDNVIANDLVGRVEPRLVGLGESRASLRVAASLGSGALASSVALDSESRGGVNVPVRTLDDLYADFTGGAVFKIDVEGFELEVLRGGRSFLSRVKPHMLCEVLTRTKNVAQTQALLGSCGYRFYHVADRGLIPAESIVAVQRERDWLFTTHDAQALAALGLPVVKP
ncbi:MAG TPA: FkbM family methyltransferase [Usitatibacter sp.]|nr:FkbM family methyltransferase [Usitatibacter sp.]